MNLSAALLVPGGLFLLGELHAMKLDGVLAQVSGDAFRVALGDETAEHRATALFHQVPAALAPRAALGQLSAAWIYGCAPPPATVALLVGHEGRTTALPMFSGCTLRQVRLGPQDVVAIGGVPVTSPLRTALDVARSVPAPAARPVLEAMARTPSLRCSLARVRMALLAAAHVPGKIRGQALVQEMIDSGPRS